MRGRGSRDSEIAPTRDGGQEISIAVAIRFFDPTLQVSLLWYPKKSPRLGGVDGAFFIAVRGHVTGFYRNAIGQFEKIEYG